MLLALLLLSVMTVYAGAEDLEDLERQTFDDPYIDLTYTPSAKPVRWARSLTGAEIPAGSYEKLKWDLKEAMHSAYAASDVGTLITLKNDTDETIDLKKLYYNTLFDYPEETFFAKTRFSYYKLTCAPGEDIRIIPDYYPGLDEAAYRQRVDEAAEACFLPGMTALEKVTVAHDWLVLNCQYDPYVANGEQPYEAADGTVYGDNPLVFTSYELFTEGNAVCQGYALAFKVLMNRAGVPCCYVNGVGHAWNGVQLDDTWYYVDVTWDDPVNIGTTGDFSGMVRRTYFLLGEETFGHETCAPWTTEYEYGFSETSCDLPAGLANAQNMAAYLIDDAFYLAERSGVLYRYAPGSDFQSGETVSTGLPTSIRAAALDTDENTLYFLSNYSTNADRSQYWWHLYTLELNAAEPAAKLLQYTKPTSQRWECGIRLRENPDVPGTKELCTWYDYAPAERIPLDPCAAQGHDFEHHDGKAATCTEIGWEAYDTCRRCDYTTYQQIDALGHTEVIDKAVDATCTESGLTEGKHCSVCGTVLAEQETVAALGHDWGEWTISAPPGYETAGEEKQSCGRCDASDSHPIPSLKDQILAQELRGQDGNGKLTYEMTISGGVRALLATYSGAGQMRTVETLAAGDGLLHEQTTIRFGVPKGSALRVRLLFLRPDYIPLCVREVTA